MLVYILFLYPYNLDANLPLSYLLSTSIFFPVYTHPFSSPISFYFCLLPFHHLDPTIDISLIFFLSNTLKNGI